MQLESGSYAHELSPRQRFVKRGFDVVFSFVFLVTVFPVVCIILAPILLSVGCHRGSMFFVQKRTGYHGKTFKCIKFRTMRPTPAAHMKQAVDDDERITRVGNFLRRTSIDEFPQFINVLKGDMSVVGPRPHMLWHTCKYSSLIPRYMERHNVKPGLTGHAQMEGFTGPTPRLEDMENRVQADLCYINNYSFGLDLRIVGQTVARLLLCFAVARRKRKI